MDDNKWAHNEPGGGSLEYCAEMSGVDAMGFFNSDICGKENVFLCHSRISTSIPGILSYYIYKSYYIYFLNI